jgi:plastocyanin
MPLQRNLAAIATASLLAIAGVSGVAGAASHRAPHKKANPAAHFVVSNAKKHMAVVTMIAAEGNANGGENFDGFSKGAMTVTVPKGWTVVVHFSVSASSGIPHSLLVTPANGKFSFTNPKPVFPGAETTNPIDGGAPGSKQTFHFKVTKPGKYRIVCAIPGHAALGMWDWLVVSPKAHVATATAR